MSHLQSLRPDMRFYSFILVLLMQLSVVACSPYEDPKEESASMPAEEEPVEEKTPEVKKQPEDIVKAFKETLHPLLLQYCGSCHGKDRAPLFAVEDASESYSALVDNAKIDLNNLKRSRIYLRVASDKHNCWTTCKKDGAELLKALETFAAKITPEEPQEKAPTTVAKKITDATLVDPIITDVRTVVLQAESGTLSGDWVVEDQDTALGGKKIVVKNGATPDSIPIAANSADLVTFDVTLQEAGTYKLFLRTNAPSAQDDELHFAIDNDVYQKMIVPQTTTTGFTWVGENAGVLTTPTNGRNLTAGAHTIKIKRLEAGLSIDMIAITKDLEFEGAEQGTFEKVPTLVFDIGTICKVPGAQFSIEVFNFNKQAYKMKNPRIVTPKPLKVTDISILVNDAANPQYATYRHVNARIEANAGLGEVLASGSMMVLYDEGEAKDRFAFSFASCGPAE